MPMNDFTVTKELSPEEFMKPRCKVKVGDRIYRKVRSMTIPDRMEVTEVIPNESGYFFKVKYMYHTVGTNMPLQRTFSDAIFNDDSWVIEKKGVDF